MTNAVRDVADLQDLVASGSPFRVRAGGSKPGLWQDGDSRLVDVGALSGAVEHLPREFTVTARAATPVSEVSELLAAAGQSLPFDPMLGAAGATLGGTVASGLSGPGRTLYGGIRDFVLGIEMVDGTGARVRGGGRVVKNAAGFDLPKLVVGSLGCFGVLTELTFKVFPVPECHRTVRRDLGSMPAACDALASLRRSSFEVAALDLDAPGVLWVRLAGRRAGVEARCSRLLALLGGGDVLGEEEAQLWAGRRELSEERGQGTVVKIPLTPRRIPELEACLAEDVRRRYTAAGQMLLLTWPDSRPLDDLHQLLASGGWRGLRLIGGEGRRILGARGDGVALGRVRQALDPLRLFPEPESP
jgi:glycolate oxidase FAD binding subunit